MAWPPVQDRLREAEPVALSTAAHAASGIGVLLGAENGIDSRMPIAGLLRVELRTEMVLCEDRQGPRDLQSFRLVRVG